MKRASMARAQTIENQLNKHKILIEDIERKIDNAILAGKTYAYIDTAIPYSVEKMLKEHGYGFRKTGYLQEIIWEDA